MANPNFGRKPGELGTTAYGDKPELEVSDDHWFMVGKYDKDKQAFVPQNVVVPPETFVYAVDQKRLEKDSGHKFLYNGRPDSPDRQTIVQIHKWIDEAAPTDSRDLSPVADWVIGERILVSRGEYVGRPGRTEVPIWKMSNDAPGLLLAGKAKENGVEINFAPSRPTEVNYILADFEGTDYTYERPGKGTETRPAVVKETDRMSEMMLVGPDGKLLARDSISDAKDADRAERLKVYRDHITKAREGQSSAKTPGKDSGTPVFTPRTP